MLCGRCGHQLVTEVCRDYEGTILPGELRGAVLWHCQACGELIDPVILANRAKSAGQAMVVCACGCRQSMPRYNAEGYDRTYLKGHSSLAARRRKGRSLKKQPQGLWGA